MGSPWDYTHNPGTNGVTLRQSRWLLGAQTTPTFAGGPGANSITAQPLVGGGHLVISALRAYLVAGGSAGSARIGIYSNTSSDVLYPATLLGQVEFSFLGTDVGFFGAALLSPLSLTDGLYWLVHHTSVAKNMAYFLTVSGIQQPNSMGWASASIPSTPYIGYGGSTPYGVLPSSFPAGMPAVPTSNIPFLFFE